MKKPNDNIFRLIQAMSPAEKRYFKRHYASDQSINTELFDLVNSLRAYDEEVVKAHFGSKIAKNLKVYKIQLYDLILKSLVSYHQKKNIVSKIRSGLEEIDVLIDKQLYRQAGDRLEKLKQLALKYEEFTYLIEIAQKEFHLFHLRNDRIGISQHPVFKETKQFLNQLENHQTFSLLGHELMDTARNRNFEALSEEEKDYFEELLQSELLLQEPEDLPFRTQLSRNALLSFMYGLLQNKKGDFKVRKDNVDLFHRFPHFKDSLSFNYIGVLRNYLNFCCHELMEEEVERTLQEAVAFASKHKEAEIHLIHFYYSELDIYFRMERFEDILQDLEPKINKHIKKYNLREERILGLTYPLLITSHLLNGDHSIVQDYFRKLEKIKPKLKDYVIAFIQLLELVSHYESGDEFIIERLMTSWHRRKKAGGISYETTPFYEDCLEFFKNLVKRPFEKLALAKAFLAQLSSYTDSKDRVYQAFMHHSMNRWVKAIIARKSFAEEMQARNQFLQKKDA